MLKATLQVANNGLVGQDDLSPLQRLSILTPAAPDHADVSSQLSMEAAQTSKRNFFINRGELSSIATRIKSQLRLGKKCF